MSQRSVRRLTAALLLVAGLILGQAAPAAAASPTFQYEVTSLWTLAWQWLSGWFGDDGVMAVWGQAGGAIDPNGGGVTGTSGEGDGTPVVDPNGAQPSGTSPISPNV